MLALREVRATWKSDSKLDWSVNNAQGETNLFCSNSMEPEKRKTDWGGADGVDLWHLSAPLLRLCFIYLLNQAGLTFFQQIFQPLIIFGHGLFQLRGNQVFGELEETFGFACQLRGVLRAAVRGFVGDHQFVENRPFNDFANPFDVWLEGGDLDRGAHVLTQELAHFGVTRSDGVAWSVFDHLGYTGLHFLAIALGVHKGEHLLGRFVDDNGFFNRDHGNSFLRKQHKRNFGRQLISIFSI